MRVCGRVVHADTTWLSASLAAPPPPHTHTRTHAQTLPCRVEPEGHGRFQLFDPILSCPRGKGLMRLGSDDDGGKLLCPMEELSSQRCLVLSIGSNGQTDFEEAILKVGPAAVGKGLMTRRGNGDGRAVSGMLARQHPWKARAGQPPCSGAGGEGAGRARGRRRYARRLAASNEVGPAVPHLLAPNRCSLPCLRALLPVQPGPACP